MSDVIKAEVPKALAEKFRKRAMKIYGYKKGAIKSALEDLMRKFAGLRVEKVDWSSLRGAIASEKTYVELQH